MHTINTEKSLRRYVLLGYASLAVMLGVGGAWSVLTKLNGAVIAPATITVESYSKKIQHKDGGIVRQILVRDGDRVTEGQSLVVLDNPDAKAELSIVTALLNESLAKRARLQAERDQKDVITYPTELLVIKDDSQLQEVMKGQDQLLASRLQTLRGKRDQLAQQIDQLKEQIAGIDAQREAKVIQLKYIAKELNDAKALATKGLIPATRLSALERQKADLDGSQGALTSDRAGTEAKIAETKLNILQVNDEYLSQTLNDLRDVEARIAELSERKSAAAARIDRLVITAPATGTIYQQSLHTVGGVVAPGETLMLLVPEGDDLVLQAQVQPKDIDQVHTGQQATVRFPTFNSRLTPEVSAEVVQVSADVSQAKEGAPPYYSVRLSLPAAEVEKLGNNKLKPGMPAEAFIETESQSPFTYFIKPLTDQFAHALRES